MNKRLLLAALVGLPAIVACTPRHAGITPQPTGNQTAPLPQSPGADASDSTGLLNSDPMAYLRDVARRAATLEQYQVTFVRQERLGAIPTLHAVERINAWFRAQPFSVKFEWQDDDSEFRQAAYVAGSEKDKVLLLRRMGLFGMKLGVERYNPQDSVTFGKTRNPVTDFGLDRMMQRTLKRLEDAKHFGGANVRYLGVETLEGTPAYHLRSEFPAEDQYPNKRTDMYVERSSNLPLGVYLWLPNGDLDAMYLYLDRQIPAAPLADEVFTIQRPASKSGKSSKQALSR